MTPPRVRIPAYTPFLIFTIAFLAFVVLKIPHLSLPFFWDESGVYGKIIFHLADTGLSLHPKAINEWISRGHPLLYPNYIAAACKIFGTTVTVSHIANFFLTCLLLLSIYVHLARAFHPYVGLVSSILLMSMPIYFTQAVFVLPEIALSLTLWWATWAFINRKFVHYFLFGAAALMIKEPAVIWIGSLFGWSLFFDRIPFGKKLLWLTPIIPFGIFLLIQKQTFGWYMFPYHTGSFDFQPESIVHHLGFYLSFLFWEQGRFLWASIVVLGLILFMMQKNNPESKQQNKKYLAALCVAFIYIMFSSTTFLGERYIMPSIIIVCSFVGFLIYKILAKEKSLVTLIILTALVFISFRNIHSKAFVYDNNMSYIRSIEVSKKTIQYMLERKMLNQDEFFASMPLIFALADARFGYLPMDTSARHSKIIHEGTKYVVLTEPGTQIENPEQFTLDTLIHWKDYDIRTTIYKVLPKDTTLLK